jgi:CRP-like cAMP-binding protein
MLTPVERVMILKGIDLLANVGPRHLIKLAGVAREVPMWKGHALYEERDPAEALYVVVEGRVKLTRGERPLSEVTSGQAFGTWALVDDMERGQRAVCVEDGMLLELLREDFYEVAAGDLTLLRELLRVLARRLRALVEDQPEQARVEGEGVEAGAGAKVKPVESGTAAPATTPAPAGAQRTESLEAAILDRPAPTGEKKP